MSLTKEKVEKIASLARFKLSDAEIEKYCGELNKIFAWIDALNEVDTSNVEPLSAVNSQYSLLILFDFFLMLGKQSFTLIKLPFNRLHFMLVGCF